VALNKRVLKVYDYVMSLPEGPTHVEMRKRTRKYVREMSDESKQSILSRADEIESEAAEEFVLRKEIFMALGFNEVQAGFYANYRLDSPGIRTIIKERVQITQHATPDEIRRINEAVPGTLRGLTELYGDGGLYDHRKAKRKT